jgi:hypothetical protein
MCAYASGYAQPHYSKEEVKYVFHDFEKDGRNQIKSPESLGYGPRCGSRRCTILWPVDWLATVHLHPACATICDRDCRSKTGNVVIGLEHLPVCSVDFSSPQSPLFLVRCNNRSLPTRGFSRRTVRYKKFSECSVLIDIRPNLLPRKNQLPPVTKGLLRLCERYLPPRMHLHLGGAR